MLPTGFLCCFVLDDGQLFLFGRFRKRRFFGDFLTLIICLCLSGPFSIKDNHTNTRNRRWDRYNRSHHTKSQQPTRQCPLLSQTFVVPARALIVVNSQPNHLQNHTLLGTAEENACVISQERKWSHDQASVIEPFSSHNQKGSRLCSCSFCVCPITTQNHLFCLCPSLKK